MTTPFDPAELDGPGLHDLGALVGQLEHLLITDDLELARGGHEPRVGSVDPADVVKILAAVRAEGALQRDRGRIGPAAAERRDVGPVDVVALGPTWKPATMTTLPPRSRGGRGPARRSRCVPSRGASRS